MNATNKHSAIEILQLIMRLIILNIFFLVSNPILLILLMTQGIRGLTTPNILLFLSLLMLGPALSTLLKTMSPLFFEEEVFAYKKYWLFYFKNFKSAFFIFLLPVLILFGLSFYTILAKMTPAISFLYPIYFIIFILVTNFMSFVGFQNAFFVVSTGTALKNALILMFQNPFILLFNCLYVLFSLLLISNFPASILFFTFSLYGYLFLAFMHRKLAELRNLVTTQHGENNAIH